MRRSITDAVLALLVSVSSLGVHPRYAIAADCDTAIACDPDAVFSFATSLYAKGDFGAAAHELARFLDFAPDDPRSALATLYLGRARAANSEWFEALRAFQSAELTDLDSPLWCTARIDAGVVSLESEHFSDAIRSFSAAVESPGCRDQETRAFALLLETLIRAHRFDAAAAALDDSPFARIESIPQRQLEDALEHQDDIPSRSVPLAAVASLILPGAGQLYAGRPKDAVLALFVNALFAAAAYESVDSGLPVVAGVVSFFGLPFYAGNAFGAANDAARFNQEALDHYADGLLEGWAPRGLGRAADRWGAAQSPPNVRPQ